VRDPDVVIPRLLSSRGFRLTRPRQAVLKVFAETEGPMSAAEIYSRIEGHRIDLVSVYRTIRLLQDIGVVRVAGSGPGFQRFELSEEFTGHHHHLICQVCGQIKELANCMLEGKALDLLKKRTLRSVGFMITDHDVQLFGRCANCYAA